MRLSGRFVRVFQWIAPVLLPALVVFGRGLLGAPMGWMTLIGLFAGPVAMIAMYIAPIIVVFDRDAKAARSTRLFYNVASWVTWGALLVVMFTLVDGGDSPPFGSALSAWGIMSSDVSSNISGVALIIAVVGWVGTLATAIVGVVQSRSAGQATQALSGL